MTYQQRNTFTDRRPLTIDNLRQIVPAAFAEAPHDSRSERYRFIPTALIIEELYKQGFEAHWAGQGRTRDASRREFTRHWLRLRHPEMLPLAVGGVFPEILLANGHDGTSAYDLRMGMFRADCLNGMCTSVYSFEPVKVRHSGNVDKIATEVIEGSFRVISQGERLNQLVGRTAETEFGHAMEYMALDAAALTWGDTPAPVEPRQLLRAHRRVDERNDMFTAFNRIQENVMKGGLEGRNASGARTTTRAVNSIDRHNKLNAGLFTLLEQYDTVINGTDEDRALLKAQLVNQREEAKREVAEATAAEELEAA